MAQDSDRPTLMRQALERGGSSSEAEDATAKMFSPRRSPPIHPIAVGVNPFTEWWREPDDDQKEAILAVTRALEFACSAILRQVPGSPERTLAVRALMDAHFQATYAITHPARPL